MLTFAARTKLKHPIRWFLCVEKTRKWGGTVELGNSTCFSGVNDRGMTGIGTDAVFRF